MGALFRRVRGEKGQSLLLLGKEGSDWLLERGEAEKWLEEGEERRDRV